MPEKHELIIKNSLEVTYKKSPGNFRDHKQFVPTHIRKLMEKAKHKERASFSSGPSHKVKGMKGHTHPNRSVDIDV